MSRLDTEVLIAGGGLVGNTLAGLLGRRGIGCIVIEAGERNEAGAAAAPDPRALAISHASQRILNAMDVWQRLPADRLGYFRRMQVWDENGDGEIEFDCADLCQPTLGYIVEQSILNSVLQETIAYLPGVKVRYGAKPREISLHTDHVSVRLDNKEQLCAELLVAADGAGSTTRELAGIACKVHDYRQQALACVVKTSLPHEDIARQRFLSSGPLAYLPMHDAQQCGIVWSSTPEHIEALLKMETGMFNESLASAFEQRLGAIEHSGHRGSFPLRRAQAERYCGERFVLIGDAAHSVHPLAGQGANLGLLDAASLAELVQKARSSGRDIAGQRVLRAYERWRKGENLMMMSVLEGFKYIFEQQSPPVPALRNRALDFADSFIPLKHTIMRHAMGLSGDLPALARQNIT